jgi:hypothetical protein
MLAIVTLLPLTLSTVPALPNWMREGARASGVIAVAAIVVLIAAANLRPLAQRVSRAVLSRIPRIHPEAWVQRIDGLLAGLVTLTHWRSGVMLIVLSIIPWIPITLAYHSVLRAVALDPTLLMAAFVVCAGALSIAAPSSPGQVGVTPGRRRR